MGRRSIGVGEMRGSVGAIVGTTLRRKLREAISPLGLRRAAHRRANGDRPAAVFLWIPRTGGTSLSRSLERAGCFKFKTLRDVQYEFSQSGLATFGHQSYRRLVECGAVSAEYDEMAWKFAFIRNPWDRAVSLYAYLKRRGLLGEHEAFRDFAGRLRDRGYDGVGLYNVRGLSTCNPQVEWLRGPDGKLEVDFLGRFESLSKDLAVVYDTLGVDVQLPHLNAEKHTHYRHVYDDVSRELVEEAYREDIEAFDYKF
jgi:hypothetical protein